VHDLVSGAFMCDGHTVGGMLGGAWLFESHPCARLSEYCNDRPRLDDWRGHWLHHAVLEQRLGSKISE